MIETGRQFAGFLNKAQLLQSRVPWDAFLARSTNAICLYYKSNSGEEVYYYNFINLYPFINKIKEYPTRHHNIMHDKFVPFTDYFGTAKSSSQGHPGDLVHSEIECGHSEGYMVTKIYEIWHFEKNKKRTNPPNTSIMRNPDEFFEYLISANYKVSSLACMSWKQAKGCFMVSGNMNLFITCFTTTYICLK